MNNIDSESFREMGEIVEALQQLSQELLGVMDKQIDAIIAADDEEIERFTEGYTDVRGRFNKQEKHFIQKLQDLLSGSQKQEGLKLKQLKKVFPGAASTIDEWETQIREHGQQLKKKHDRLVELLDFALQQNVDHMHAIYSLHNRQNTHYSSGGNKEEISAGIAINKEA